MNDRETGADTPESLADRINRAFDANRRSDGKPWTNREVVKWLGTNRKPGDSTISEAYLALLRSGERDNPSVSHLRALARFFQIPATYFLQASDSDPSVQVDIDALAAMRDPDVRRVAFRTMGMPPEERQWLSRIVDDVTMPVRERSVSPEVRRMWRAPGSEGDE
jgi:transcriptional regulator with XRE-family HTH domain